MNFLQKEKTSILAIVLLSLLLGLFFVSNRALAKDMHCLGQDESGQNIEVLIRKDYPNLPESLFEIKFDSGLYYSLIDIKKMKVSGNVSGQNIENEVIFASIDETQGALIRYDLDIKEKNNFVAYLSLVTQLMNFEDLPLICSYSE